MGGGSTFINAFFSAPCHLLCLIAIFVLKNRQQGDSNRNSIKWFRSVKVGHHHEPSSSDTWEPKRTDAIT